MRGHEESGESSRERILATALSLLAERGYEGTSLQAVADGAGLHKSSLFHHFPSKEALAREVYRGVGERLLKRVEPLLAAEPPRLAQALEAADALVDHFAAEPDAARLVMRLMVAGPRDPASARPFAVDREDSEHPIQRLLVGIGSWLARARAAGAVRRVRVRHTLLDLVALVLFYPAVADSTGRGVLDADPMAPEPLRIHKRELRAWLEGALAPR